MKRKAKLVIILGVCSLVLAPVGQTQQLTATGISTGAAVALGAFHTCALLQDGGGAVLGTERLRPAQ